MVLAMLAFALVDGQETLPQAKPTSHKQTREQREPSAAQAEAAANAKELSNAKTAALVVRATSTVSCPGGAPGDCIRTDTGTISQVQSLIDNSDLWSYLEKMDSTQADIILDFEINDGATATFTVRDSDSNRVLYSEYRQVVSLDNDVNRIIVHFLAGLPKRTEAEQLAFAKKKECTEIVARYNAERIPYEEKVKDFNWKNSHEADGIMNECEQHWKDYVCLDASAASQTHGHSIYADKWNQSIVEFWRKLKLENEELLETKKQLDAMQETFKTSTCAAFSQQ
jgi:inorganic pyrophosphatase